MRPAAQLPNQALTGDGAKHQAVDYVTIKAQLTGHLQSRKATESDGQTHTNNRGPSAEIKQPHMPTCIYMNICALQKYSPNQLLSCTYMCVRLCMCVYYRIYLTGTGMCMYVYGCARGYVCVHALVRGGVTA